MPGLNNWPGTSSSSIRREARLFCAECGVKSFYRPRSNPDGWSVNARCLDAPEAVAVEINAFDGVNWEANAAGLAHLSQEHA